MDELLGFLTVLCIVGSIVAIEKRIDRVRNMLEMRIGNLEKELKEAKKGNGKN